MRIFIFWVGAFAYTPHKYQYGGVNKNGEKQCKDFSETKWWTPGHIVLVENIHLGTTINLVPFLRTFLLFFLFFIWKLIKFLKNLKLQRDNQILL